MLIIQERVDKVFYIEQAWVPKTLKIYQNLYIYMNIHFIVIINFNYIIDLSKYSNNI